MPDFKSLLNIPAMVLLTLVTLANAQNHSNGAAPGSFRAAQEEALDLELDPDFDSVPVGKKQNWQLDSGYFEDENPSAGSVVGEDPIGEYSGLRFRLPTK